MALESSGETTRDLHGYGTGYVPRAKLPPGTQFPARQLSNLEVPDIEQAPLKYLALALLHLRNQFANMAKQAEDRSKPVDEYTPQTLVAEAETNIFIKPDYDMTENIQSVVIVGPAGAVTLQLGDRTWNLTIPATGVIVIAPVSIRLSRSDNRILTAGTPGNYTVELMGFADDRTG
jgi:hypothetical protein